MKLSRQLPLHALRVFEAVARLSSFTKAGEELGMTQTAVSYQIKLLEEHLGEKLFFRLPRRIEMTEIGHRLLPKISDAFNLLQEAILSATRRDDEVLEIHSSPTFASQWLAKTLGSFQLEYPNIAVRLLRGSMLTDFNREPADVAIRVGQGPWPGLTCRELIRLSYTPMLSPKLAASIGGIEKPADLLKLPWISDADTRWRDWFLLAGLEAPPRSVGKLDALGVLDLEAGAALAGHGVAMLSPFYVQDELLSGRLIQPFDISWTDENTYWLVYPQSRRHQPKIKAFETWLVNALGVDSQAQ
ncbi:LysR family transcriptional regulator [Peteryoungia desertarenae]|uniref:LysR family transcriptional regulator n=1 Tax=Peteryoungia desertarenae TaxID=1813451 RepID=A0ABX6QI92_9HYPH|nr:LysR substrate-binding domain-containing protein [Peteryoungia desertarenae]QLF68283.1 LysR family transcriptional regulator [Peteryoungia desertarenae]